MIISSKVEINFIACKNDAPVFLYINAKGMPHNGEALYKEIQKKKIEASVVEVLVDDWNLELSPWEAPAIRTNQEGFGGGGLETLTKIRKEILPDVSKKLNPTKIYLLGYSLAGLFSIWSLFESADFDGAVCCSSSLWYPSWKEYIDSSKLKNKSEVYLSLGNKESKTNNITMSTIKEMTEHTYEQLKTDEKCDKATLVMNPGGHFTDPLGRLVSGIEWITQINCN